MKKKLRRNNNLFQQQDYMENADVLQGSESSRELASGFMDTDNFNLCAESTLPIRTKQCLANNKPWRKH